MTHWNYSSHPPEKEVEMAELVFPATWQESSSASPERSDSKRRTVLCDLDGTILLPSEDPTAEPEPTPYLEKIKGLGIIKAICTNQEGIAWNVVGGRPGRKYPNWNWMIDRVLFAMRLTGASVGVISLFNESPLKLLTGMKPEDIEREAEDLQIPKEVYRPLVSYRCSYLLGEFSPIYTFRFDDRWIYVSWKSDWQKPNPGMILHALEVLGVPPSPDVFYVGDEEEDVQTAKNAGVSWVWVKRNG